MQKRLLPGFLIVLTIAASANAAVRTFVATSGIDNAECSRVSPCRTFGAALLAVDAGGEILPLDSGGYGPFTINKSVAVIVPPEVHAAIAPTSGTAIVVIPGASGKVVLRGLFLNAQGGFEGIGFGSGDLYVESAMISGFNFGIDATPSVSGRVFVTDTTIRSAGIGFRADGNGNTLAVSISNTRLYDNANGIDADEDARVTVSRSIIARSSRGIRMFNAAAQVNLDESVIANHLIGVELDFGILRLNNTVITDGGAFAIVNDAGTIETMQNNSISNSGALPVQGAVTPITGD